MCGIAFIIAYAGRYFNIKTAPKQKRSFRFGAVCCIILLIKSKAISVFFRFTGLLYSFIVVDLFTKCSHHYMGKLCFIGKGGRKRMAVRSMSDTEDAMRKYTNLVYGIALTHTASKADADDVFQDTFLAYHRSDVKWRDEVHRKAWLIKTAVNMSKRITLSTWYKRTVPIENSEEQSVDFDYGLAEQNIIMNAIKKLPKKYRCVIWLYYFDGMPVNEIAKAVDMNKNTVRSHLVRGREMLGKLLEREGISL